jgi:muconolactone delta-isomerase
MKILAIEKEIPGVAGGQFKPFLKAEAAKVWELYQSGVIREMYFDNEKHSAVLMLECSDAGEAKKVLQTLPLMKEGLIDFDVIPLAPYPGFGRLFAEKE